MAAGQQKFTVEISEKYTAEERRAIAAEIIQRITERTRDEGKDKNNRAFKGYSESYKGSLDFKIAGKGSKVDLTLTGEMIDAIELLKASKGSIEIGYQKGDPINGKVEGNRLGTYGKPQPVAPPRDFLGITKSDLQEILRRYPIRNEDRRSESVAQVKAAERAAEDVLTRVGLELEEVDE
jgi:hypothetical protein